MGPPGAYEHPGGGGVVFSKDLGQLESRSVSVQGYSKFENLRYSLAALQGGREPLAFVMVDYWIEWHGKHHDDVLLKKITYFFLSF